MFKIKSLNGMLEYKVKMFVFLLLFYWSMVKNIVLKYIMLKAI